MQHRKRGRKLGREIGQRKALMRSLVNSLIKYEKIETTEAKAKELRPRIEKLITKAKINNLSNRRLLLKTITKTGVKKLIDEIAPKYKERPGGYTRITKLGQGRKDNSRLAKIEFV